MIAKIAKVIFHPVFLTVVASAATYFITESVILCCVAGTTTLLVAGVLNAFKYAVIVVLLTLMAIYVARNFY